MKKLIYITVIMISSLSLSFGQAMITINNSYIREYGGTNPTLGGKAIYIVVNNSNSNAIAAGNGWIVSENEFDKLRWIINNNVGNYVVPFGYSSSYALPVSINIQTAGTGSGWIDFSTWHTIADNWKGVVSVTGPPSDVTNMTSAFSGGSPSNSDNSYNVVDRFWAVDASSYTKKPTLTNMQFNYISQAGTPSEASGPNVFVESGLLAQRFNNALSTWGDWMGSIGTDVISGTTAMVSVGAVSPSDFYSSWTLTNSSNPLPISISSLTSQCDNGNALIQWTSQTEVNNASYTVKKTIDGFHFEAVTTIPGAGNSSFPINYQVTDDSPFPGQSYYYLYQTDFDGKTAGANILITVFNGCGLSAISDINAYNTNSYIEIQINAKETDNYTITLVSMLGQIVFSGPHAIALGSNEIRLNNNISPGVYVLNVNSDKMTYTKKIVIGIR